MTIASTGASSPGRTAARIRTTFQTLLEYPKGFLVSYSTSFGNDAPSFIRFMGKKATLMNFGTEGTPRWLQVEEKGNFEDDPEVTREEKWLSLAGDGGKGPAAAPDDDLSHLINWFDALRNSRQPSAPVQAGYAHSVACIMAASAYWSGKRLCWDARNETILDQAPRLTDRKKGRLLCALTWNR